MSQGKSPRRKSSKQTPLQALAGLQPASREAVSKVMESLGPVLQRENVEKVNLERVLYASTDKGVLVNASVALKERVTKKDLKAKAHVVAVFVTTGSLSEPRISLPPGAYAVKLRPEKDEQFALDFINTEGHISQSVPARLRDPEGYRDTKDDELVAHPFLQLIDLEIGFGDGISFCASFLWWSWC